MYRTLGTDFSCARASAICFEGSADFTGGGDIGVVVGAEAA